MLMIPELIILATALLVLMAGTMSPNSSKALAPLSMIGIAASFVALVFFTPQTGEMLGGRFVLDPVAWWFKILFLVAGILTVAMSLDMLDGRVTKKVKGMASGAEYYMILLSTMAGMMYLCSARDLISLYVSLELTTIPLFLLTAWIRDDIRSGEAGLKYVIIGAMASGVMLYALSLFYGLTGSTDLDVLRVSLTSSPALLAAAALLVGGIGFKLTLVPFHMWAPDVYEGAPLPITAYLSVASKGAGLVFLFHIFYRVLGGFLPDWGVMVAILATATMTFGNVVAIWQKNIKRFMAFSAISQAGYLIMGFLGKSAEGVPAMLFYLLVYIISNLVVFAVIIFYANETGREQIEEYKGLARRHPMLSLAMMIGLFSLAGIPPLPGFVGKFFLFSVASKANFHWLVLVAAVNSTISLYYYLRVIKEMYVDPLPAGDEKELRITPVLATTVSVSALAMVAMGLLPFFYEWVHTDTIGWLRGLGL